MPDKEFHTEAAANLEGVEAAVYQLVNATIPEDKREPYYDALGLYVEPDYDDWSKADVVAEANARGLDSTGSKADIVERLEGGGA
jgi:hypothetical protein